MIYFSLHFGHQCMVLNLWSSYIKWNIQQCHRLILVFWKHSQEPILPGCFLRARAIGVMPMIDQVRYRLFSKNYKILLTNLLIFVDTMNQGEKDDKIIAVCADDPEYRHYSDIKELPPHRLAEIRRFFEDCILWKLNYYYYYYKCWNLYHHFGRCNIVYLDN